MELPATHGTTILRAATRKMTSIMNINKQNFHGAQILGTQIFLATPLVMHPAVHMHEAPATTEASVLLI